MAVGISYQRMKKKLDRRQLPLHNVPERVTPGRRIEIYLRAVLGRPRAPVKLHD